MQYTTQPQIAMMVKDAGVDSTGVSIQYLLGLIVSTKKAHIIIQHYGADIREIVSAAKNGDLHKLESITKTDEVKISGAIELATRYFKSKSSRIKINEPWKAAKQVEWLRTEPQELFCVMSLNTRRSLIGVDIISKGTLNASIVHPREVFKSALKRNAAVVILIHNHPTGSTIASTEDVTMTRRLVDCGVLMGIQVIDHIIVGENERYNSFKESMPQLLNTPGTRHRTYSHTSKTEL
jgi:DNA repair protein RadC